MKMNRKVIEGATVAAFALTVMITAAVNSNGSDIAESNAKEEVPAEEVSVASKERSEETLFAAAMAKKAEIVQLAEAVPEETVQPAEATSEEPALQAGAVAVPQGLVLQAGAAAVPEGADAQAEVIAVPEEPVPQAEIPEEDLAVQSEEEAVSEWSARLMPNVEESLNIRMEPSEEAQLAGKLYKGAAADIVERGEEWSKISSGSVEGYVKNEFCVFDQEAEAMAQEQGIVYATALTGGVRIRREADTGEDVTICDILGEGKKIRVDTEAEAPEGWVAVSCADSTAYVSAEYVSVELELKEAISIEEELEAIRKAEEEKAAASQSSSKSSSRTQKKSVSASYDEVTLLGALIQCEAGSECYEGKVAVGAVVMNRLRSGWASSISGVIYQSGQFTPAYSGTLSSVLSSGVSSSCLQAAQEAISGVDNVSGATSFRRAGSASGIVIGNHVFF